MRILLLKHRFMLCASGTGRKEANNYLSWSSRREQTVHWQNPGIRIDNTAVGV